MPKKASKPSTASIKKQQKGLILQALTDPKFRKLLEKNPEKALGVSRLTAENLKEVNMVLAAVKGINTQISSMADQLLCVNPPGGCGIA